MSRMNKTKYSLLGLLSIRPMTGYDIKKYVEASINYFWNESYGQIYPSLKYLSSEGLATREIERQESRPDRKVYSITDRGREVLRESLTETPERQPPRDELALKTFFGHHVPPVISIEHLEEELARLEEVGGYLEEVERRLVEKLAGEERGPYVLATVRLGKYSVEARVKWCRETIEMLRGLEEAEEGERREP